MSRFVRSLSGKVGNEGLTDYVGAKHAIRKCSTESDCPKIGVAVLAELTIAVFDNIVDDSLSNLGTKVG